MLLVDGEPVSSPTATVRAVRSCAFKSLFSSWSYRLPVFAGEQREGARGGAHGEPRALRRVRTAKGRAGEADLVGAWGAQARLRLPAGVRHGGSGARRGACSGPRGLVE
jgi:hypothetical protein